MADSRYATVCAILCGLANFLLWCGFDSNVFISESVLHSVHGRDAERIGAHDGYYGMAVTNGIFMVFNLIVPSLTNYFRCKWILTLSAALFFLYFISFPMLNRWLFFVASVVLGMAFSAFHVGYSGYLTEFSTRTTIERNAALSWGVSGLSVMGGAIVNLVVTTVSLRENSGIISKYREYSDTEITCFFAAFALLSCMAVGLFAFLPNRQVEGNIAASNVRSKSFKEQLRVTIYVLVHRRVLILAPFYLYIGLFFSFWTSIIPTTLQFTKVLSQNVYIPAYFGITFTFGCIFMSVMTMKLSAAVEDFSLKPLMIINIILHLAIYAVIVCVIPEWSSVRPNEEPSLLIQPTLFPILVLAFLFGLADAANNTARTVISSLLLPPTRQQTFAASRFYHGLSACVLLFLSPSLPIYAYVAILTAFLVVSTFVFFWSCDFIRSEELNATESSVQMDLENKERQAKQAELGTVNTTFTRDE